MTPSLELQLQEKIRSVLERRRQMLVQQEALRPDLLPPCILKVLLVCDEGLYFSDEDFGLSDFIEILATTTTAHVRFEITTGHRRDVNDTQAGIGNPFVQRGIREFRFTNSDHFAPGMYDEVWLFGFEAGTDEADPSPQELRILTEFMNDGGGLFATGDHGALGERLCARIPRARSMRKWYSSTGPFGAPPAPGMTDADRHDTNRPGYDATFAFDDQSDDIPQEIDPIFYSIPVGPISAAYPHPLLCGPNGVIRILPDHPHEGECIVPWEFDRKLEFDGVEFEEYPPATDGGVRPLPEVLAMARVLPNNFHPGKVQTNPRTFGVNGAYNGHRAGVGRVVVDATWHHFININLTGVARYPASNPKSMGFLTLAGTARLETIKAYYRNIAVWLASPERHACMFYHALWQAVWDGKVLESVTDGHPVRLESISLDRLVVIGTFAREVLGGLAGQCQTYEWILNYLPLGDRLLVDPWLPKPPEPDPPPFQAPWLDLTPLVNFTLGAAVVRLREEFPRASEAARNRDMDRITALFEEGLKAGLSLGKDSLRDARLALKAAGF
jgi:hypothetical protein